MSRRAAKARRAPAPAVPEAPAPTTPPDWLFFLDRHARAIAIAAVLLATARIAATYPAFSETYDEPAHIGAGMEWLERGTYTWEPQHPPLARVATAIGPRLLGRHIIPDPQRVTLHDIALLREGNAILYDGHQMDRTLTAARLGILPFFWLGCLVMWEWGRRFYGARAGALAVAILTFIPPVLGHGGLATTDMALTATCGAAFLCGLLWLERPDAPRSILFGAATALAVLSKFSSLVFLPAAFALAAVAYCSIRMPDRGQVAAIARRWPMLLLAVLTGALLIWAGYRFSFQRVPAPELWEGIAEVRFHNSSGHITYLLGQVSTTGWWYYFPVVLFFKTPLALLALLLLWAAVPALRARWTIVRIPLAFSAAILGIGMASRINLGLRHILPVYLGIAIAAAVAVDTLASEVWSRWVSPTLLVLALGFAASSLLAHPDYFPYFNELAGSHPENISVDSDLEWGQDLKRVASRLRDLNADHVNLLTYLQFDPHEFGLPPAFDSVDPKVGWTAIDVTTWKKRFSFGAAGANRVLWMDRIPPTEKVGTGFYLWYLPPR